MHRSRGVILLFVIKTFVKINFFPYPSFDNYYDYVTSVNSLLLCIICLK